MLLAVVSLTVGIVSEAAGQGVQAQAIPASPFGVGSVSFTISPTPEGESPDLAVSEAGGRLFYPVFGSGPLARIFGGAPDAAGGSGNRTVYFLFTGTAPLRVTINSPARLSVTVVPQPAPQRQLERLLTRWWREYYSAAAARISQGDYPPLVEVYLVEMLARRLNLQPPLLARIQDKAKGMLGETMELLFTSETAYVEAIRATMSGRRGAAVADQPLPPDIAWVPLNMARGLDVEIEPMAKHVPEECFYVRFGTFENYIWLEELLTSFGGDVSRMVAARGHDARLGDRVRRQLAMPYSALAKIFGGQLIADVALIGRDMYMQDGAAVGVLLQARNSGALRLVLDQQRRATVQAEEAQGATLETVKLAGQDVSFLSTPDNQLRSYYAIDGDFHLVTTSREVAERFLQAGQGLGALGDSPEFERARASLPLDRRDTIFAFLSTSFLSGLMGPQYQIELPRRIQAVTNLELVQLARQAAANEGAPAETIEALIAGGFLPSGFGRAPDGSGPIVTQSGAIDSLRGARGTFTPIPDVPLAAATAAEVATYNERANYFAEKWRQLDPIVAAVQRRAEPDGRIESLTIDASIAPLAEQKYGWLLGVLGPPVVQQVAPRVGDVLAVQAYVTGGETSTSIPPHLLFVGIQDLQPVLQGNTSGILQTLQLLRTTPGYLGAWPKPGFLDWLPLRAPPAPDGFSRLPFDLWRWQGGGFSVLSFHREILEATVPQLHVIDAEQPAQVRVHVGDISRSQLQDWVNGLYYQRAWDTSVANARMLQALTQQLGVPPAEALATAERLLDTHLLCPLGGEYQLVTSPSGRASWRSSAWNNMVAGQVPADFRAPPLQWLRGLDAALTRSGDQLVLHALARMERPATEKAKPGSTLPLLDLFRGSKPE